MAYEYRTSFTAAAQADREETVVDGRFSSSGDIALSDGSVTQGAIYFADDKNTGIYSPSNDSIAFTTAGSQALNLVAGTADGKKTNSFQLSGYGDIDSGAHKFAYGRGSQSAGISIYGYESSIELVGSDASTHAGSLLFRHHNNKGFGFVHNGTDEVLELKAFTSSDDNFNIFHEGSNVSSLETVLTVNDSSINFTGAGGGVTTAYTDNDWKKIIFDDSYSTAANGPNKIIIHNDSGGNGWKGGFGMSSNELGMYSGGNITFYGNAKNNIAGIEALAKFKSDAGVELFYDGATDPYFKTIANGVSIKHDDKKLFCGAEEEMQVFHDGTQSVIKDTRNDGIVRLQADKIHFVDKDASEVSPPNLVVETGTGTVRSRDKFMTYITGGSGSLLIDRASITSNVQSDGTTSNIADPHGGGSRIRLFKNHIIFECYALAAGDAVGATVSYTERLQIQTDGNVKVTDGDLLIGTGGHGINFSNQTTSSEAGVGGGSETLNHYEEGTWTPIMTKVDGSTTALSAAAGYYTKVGRVVHIQLEITVIDTGESKAMSLTGLPFTSQDTAESTAGLVQGNTNCARTDTYYVVNGITQIGIATQGNADVAQSNYSTKKLTLSGHYYV